MKIFLDTADLNEIKKANETGLLDGVTTNPTLILKSGNSLESTAKLLQQEYPNFESISTEVVADTAEEMIEQAQQYINIGDAITIKVPCTVEGLKACKSLSDSGIKTNVTLVFSVAQAIMAAKAGATYVSPFVGRCNDNSFSGVELIRAIAGTYNVHGVKTQVLAASLRDCHHVSRCYLYGAKVVTMPPKVFWKMYDHVLTREGLDLFQKDWESVNDTSNKV
jgi:transaldolase